VTFELTRRRWRRIAIVVHRIVDFAGHVVGRFLEFFDALSQTFGQFRKLLGPEKNEHNGKDKNDFPATKHSSKKDVHKRLSFNAATLIAGLEGVKKVLGLNSSGLGGL
jgi:hypothetical protein